jgi:carbamoyltransferase
MRQKVESEQDVENVLGLACTGHGASLALVRRDGTVRASVFERWVGVKQCLMFARDEQREIQAGEDDLNRAVRDVLCWGAGKFPPHRIFEEALPAWSAWFLAESGLTAEDIDLVVCSPSHFATCYARLGTQLQTFFPRTHVHNKIEHHAVHQRQAFWQSGFDEAAVLTLDTCGEPLERLGGKQISGTIGVFNQSGRQQVLKELPFPESSPGIYYDIASLHLGFHQGQEGKTMGLAAYGGPRLLSQVENELKLQPDGTFTFMPGARFHARVHEYVGGRAPGNDFLPEHADVAFAAQTLIERIVSNAFQAALRLTGQKRIAYAGGIGLNSVSNEIALRASSAEALYVAPNPGDPGHALGCALYGAHELVGFAPRSGCMPEYLGPRYSTQDVAAARASAGPHHAERPAEHAQTVARLIANGYIVARFSGGAEFGPRALGNRSILCDPRPPGMKDYLNRQVKHREPFRPFAPVVLAEQASEWFDIEGTSPFMLRVVPARPERKARIPAVVHVDGSARIQTVTEAENPGLVAIIRAFAAISGIPIVLNTSFNIGGNPIVETPLHAAQAFASTKIDVLLLEDWILTRRPLAECLNTPLVIPDSVG